MTAYTTWTDLDDAPDTQAAVEPLLVGARPTRAASADELVELGAPPEIVELFRQKEELEQKLKGYAGQPTGAVDPRDAKRFPVKVHTKETRIEERRLRRRDEQLAHLNQRSLERARVERARAEQAWQSNLRELAAARARREEQELRDLARRRTLEHATLRRRAELLRQNEDEQAQRERDRNLAAASLTQQRKQHAAEQLARETLEREARVASWAQDRESAALKTRLARQHQQQALERHEQARRSACAQRRADLNRTLAESQAEEAVKRQRRLQLQLERAAAARRQARRAERV